jgi:hypothetical protein
MIEFDSGIYGKNINMYDMNIYVYGSVDDNILVNYRAGSSNEVHGLAIIENEGASFYKYLHKYTIIGVDDI